MPNADASGRVEQALGAFDVRTSDGIVVEIGARREGEVDHRVRTLEQRLQISGRQIGRRKRRAWGQMCWFDEIDRDHPVDIRRGGEPLADPSTQGSRSSCEHDVGSGLHLPTMPW
jgi:hypothetical protein